VNRAQQRRAIVVPASGCAGVDWPYRAAVVSHKTESTKGKGNLVIGYDENSGGQLPPRRATPGAQTGSHNLILGEEPELETAIFGGKKLSTNLNYNGCGK
jgi:hypothetical protein